MEGKRSKSLMFICIILLSGMCCTSCKMNGAFSWNKNKQLDNISSNSDNLSGRKVMEILWQQGGSGEYLTPTIEEFKKHYPEYDIKVDYNLKVHDIIRPRLVAGNPPDIFMAHHSFFDHYGAIKAGQLTPIDDILESKMPDSEETLKGIFKEDVLKLGFVDGKHYLFPDQQYINGFWYSKKLFEQKGWNVPTTWDEFLTFCEEVRNSSGGEIAPFGYAGLNAPFYLSDSFIMPSIVQLGGKQAIDDINNLKPGAWKSPAVIETIKRIRLLVDRRYMYDGSLKINHNQVQMLFINGKIAMLPVGSWIESEMKDSWPEDFGLTAIAPPLGYRNIKYMVAYNTLIAIPQNAKNGDMSKEFMKLFYTRGVMATVAKEYQSLFPVRNNVEIAKGSLPESVIQIFTTAMQQNVKIISHPWTYWYKTLDKKYQDSITAVVARDITPEKFAEEMEKEAENIRQDDSIPKYSID